MTSSANSHPSYRPDIDGMRAIAVLSVVVYHAFPLWGRGGFVGVDIFFVISGYLISTIIFDNFARGQFSYADFYDRRIRRIFPALILVLATCLVFAVTAAFPLDARLIGKHTLSGAGFVSNLVLWSEAGYFDSASELKPLLHLWSLSVEEQYYIVWPLVVAMFFKRSRWMLCAMLLLLAASFALNVATISEHPTAAFYSPASRMWELLIGSVLAYRKHSRSTQPGQLQGIGLTLRQENALALLGAALLALGIVCTSPLAPFPGWWALLPTLGSMFLIAAGSQAWFNRKVLANRLLVFVGKISYPLYLWHWPLLAFPKILYGEASRGVRIGSVAASILLAWLTYRYVEQPIRLGARNKARVPIALAAIVASLAACGASLMASDGWLNRLPPEMREISMAESRFDYSRYRSRSCFLDPDQTASEFKPECSAPPQAGERSVLLWGDSHAASLYPGLEALVAANRSISLTQLTASACPPIAGFKVESRPNCAAINDAVIERVRRAPPDTILMAANWSLYNGSGGWERLDTAALERTVRQLLAAGVGRVVLIGQLPRWRVSQPTNIMREWRETHTVAPRSMQSINLYSFEVDAAVRQVAAQAGAVFISPIERLCDPSGCTQTVVWNHSTFPVAWDDAHLTTQASEIYVKEWIGPLLAAQ